jgi:hypothetical protein
MCLASYRKPIRAPLLEGLLESSNPRLCKIGLATPDPETRERQHHGERDFDAGRTYVAVFRNPRRIIRGSKRRVQTATLKIVFL